MNTKKKNNLKTILRIGAVVLFGLISAYTFSGLEDDKLIDRVKQIYTTAYSDNTTLSLMMNNKIDDYIQIKDQDMKKAVLLAAKN